MLWYKKLFSNVYWFKLISQVSNVALGSLVIMILIRLNISQIVCSVLYVWKINLGKTACTITPALSLWNRKKITTNSLQRFHKSLYIMVDCNCPSSSRTGDFQKMALYFHYKYFWLLLPGVKAHFNDPVSPQQEVTVYFC